MEVLDNHKRQITDTNHIISSRLNQSEKKDEIILSVYK